jgi:hypothetical protein
VEQIAPRAHRPSRRPEPRPRRVQLRARRPEPRPGRVQLLEARREREEPPLGLGVKAPLRRFAALTPASLRLEGQCGSRWLPLLDERGRLQGPREPRTSEPLRTRALGDTEWERWLAPSSTR